MQFIDRLCRNTYYKKIISNKIRINNNTNDIGIAKFLFIMLINVKVLAPNPTT